MMRSIQSWLEDRRARAITPEGARRRAAAGAAILDGYRPGWYREVDPENLQMGSSTGCVLGQIHGSFIVGLARTRMIDRAGVRHSPVDLGFVCIQRVCDALQEQDYDYLNQAWQEELACRCEADAEARVALLDHVDALMKTDLHAMPMN